MSEQDDLVEKFIRWVERTPHDSLTGNSRVAYDAQVRVLRQLQWYLAGGDDTLNAYVEAAAVSPIGDRCTCWIGRGEWGGSDRSSCLIHKEPPPLKRPVLRDPDGIVESREEPT
jgi:hypothetical protein